jgi:hypothetical protein
MDSIRILNYKMHEGSCSELERILSLEPQYTQVCPYCNTTLKGVHTEDHGHWELIIFGCFGCGWFCEVEVSGIHKFYCFPAILKEELNPHDVRYEEIARRIIAQKDLGRRLNPETFENVIATTLDGLFDGEVIHVGGPSDGGVDVIVLDGNEKIVVQVKRRSSSKYVEGVSVIREFLGGMVLSESKHGMFITTADHFSREADIASKKSVTIGAINKLELIDSEKLLELLRLVWIKKHPPWEKYIKD